MTRYSAARLTIQLLAASVPIPFAAMKATTRYWEMKVMTSCLVAKLMMVSTAVLGMTPWPEVSATIQFWAVSAMTIYLEQRVMIL
jgi:hypothetical protein